MMGDSLGEQLVCHRCSAVLTPGRSNFYVVRIEAFADPTGPSFDETDFQDFDYDEAFDRLLEEMKVMSDQELMDQVHRRVTLHLCGQCYRRWIENPAGG